jgi:MFS family permease
VALALAFFILPADRVPEGGARRNFDYAGLVLSTLGVLSVVYAFTLVSQTQPGTVTPTSPNGQLYGWGYWPVWAFLALGLLLLLLFAIYELRISKDPVLDLRLFRSRDFTLASIVSWANAVVVFGSLLMLPIFLQQVRLPHLSPLDAGLTVLPQGVAAGISVVLGGRLYNRVGVRPLVVVGCILLTISSWLLATQVTPTSDGYALMPMLIMRGFGFGLTLLPVQTLALEVITGPALPKASSLYNVTRQIFSSVGVAATITLFVQQTASHAATLIEDARSKLPAGVTLDPNSPQVQTALQNIRAQAGTDGFKDVFFYVTVGTLVMTLIAFALPGRRAMAQRRMEAPEAGHAPRVLAE